MGVQVVCTQYLHVVSKRDWCLMLVTVARQLVLCLQQVSKRFDSTMLIGICYKLGAKPLLLWMSCVCSSSAALGALQVCCLMQLQTTVCYDVFSVSIQIVLK